MNLYFCFQCFASIFNIKTLILDSYFMLFVSGSVSINSDGFSTILIVNLVLLMLFILLLVHVLTTLIATYSTFKILQGRTLNKIQKYSSIIFIILTIIIYPIIIRLDFLKFS